MAPTTTLKQAFEDAARTRWTTQRSGPSRVSQARIAVDTLVHITGNSSLRPADVTTAQLHEASTLWRVAGNGAGTIAHKLTVLHVLGVNIKGAWPRMSKPTKWYLRQEDENRLTSWLVADNDPACTELAYHISTVMRVGMRVEESLRLRWRDLRGLDTTSPSIIVPGTKTATAHATLPLGAEAAVIYLALRRATANGRPAGDQRLYPHLDYTTAYHLWNDCREFLGVTDIPTSTLRALRRSAARYLHSQKGMPLDLVREYLRHEDVKTTMGYLRLTGGYGEKELRKWL